MDVLAIRSIVGGMNLTFRRASPDDAPALTALMHSSAAYQGDYARILDGYAVTPTQIATDIVMLVEAEGVTVGFYSLVTGVDSELDLMFVADTAQGIGLGRRLFDHMRQVAAERGIAAIKIVSHPPSVGFYLRMGAKAVGMKPAEGDKITWDRPVLRLPIS
ncbi:GNAT superfamily N-acetyltransferase [Sphingobium sp. OAS761]|uniref:GNAT family N-acetyltransferase n=1 Tax=Sphingobium sp. OAS761 TaxID=2817901 RepID=UPI00209DCE99|nr:GNAT family N-acetyltransferase [Sphingobium sp. OAS761]MCP1470432.1 GNAT superfamily N-acetyltransferase [Sphingobium sp. OAS761]